MFGSSDSNRSEAQGGSREASPKAGRSEEIGRRDTNRQRGRARATSELAIAKSNRHRKPRQVEPGASTGKFARLTRGDLRGSGRAEVSRGHSSAEGAERRRSEGPKSHETILVFGLGMDGHEARRNGRRGDRRLGAGSASWIAGAPAAEARLAMPAKGDQ